MRPSVFVDEITPEWIQANAAEAYAAIASAARTAAEAAGSSAQAAAVLAARSEGETAERERVVGIQTAAKGHALDELAAQLIADGTPLADATAKLLDAVRAKGGAALNALRSQEHQNPPPAPSNGTDPTTHETAKAAVKLARSVGAVQ